MKKCSVCGKEKPDSEFYRHGDSLQSSCKMCEHCRSIDRKSYFDNYNNSRKENQRKYYHDRREHYSELELKHKTDLKWKYIGLLGGRCLNHKINFDCELIATKENMCIFDFHHPEPIKKSGNNRRGCENPSSKNFDLKKVIILCSNCHRLETKRQKNAKKPKKE